MLPFGWFGWFFPQECKKQPSTTKPIHARVYSFQFLFLAPDCRQRSTRLIRFKSLLFFNEIAIRNQALGGQMHENISIRLIGLQLGSYCRKAIH